MFIAAALLGGEEINWKLLCKHVRGVTDAWAELFSKHSPLLCLFPLKYFKSYFPAVKELAHGWMCNMRNISLDPQKLPGLTCLFIYVMSGVVKQIEDNKWKNSFLIWNAAK